MFFKVTVSENISLIMSGAKRAGFVVARRLSCSVLVASLLHFQTDV